MNVPAIMNHCHIHLYICTEQLDSCGNFSYLYSGGVWFESGPGH